MAAERQRQGAGFLGGELQPAARGQGQPGDLADHGGEPAMAQPLLHHQQHRPVVPGLGSNLGINHPVGVQADAGEARSEQVGSRQRPQHRPIEPCRDAGGEQHRRRLVGGPLPTGRDLVQGAERQPALGQGLVEGIQAERQHAAAVPLLPCLQVADAPAKVAKDQLAA